jgi:hypothetical protein
MQDVASVPMVSEVLGELVVGLGGDKDLSIDRLAALGEAVQHRHSHCTFLGIVKLEDSKGIAEASGRLEAFGRPAYPVERHEQKGLAHAGVEPDRLVKSYAAGNFTRFPCLARRLDTKLGIGLSCVLGK